MIRIYMKKQKTPILATELKRTMKEFNTVATEFATLQDYVNWLVKTKRIEIEEK